MKKNKKAVVITFITFLVINVIAFIMLAIVHATVFRRYDFEQPTAMLRQEDVDSNYPRELATFEAKGISLTAYIYGAKNTDGLIVVSAGQGNASEDLLPQIMYFVDMGFQVFTYDYTGSYRSDGKNTVGHIQSVIDLDHALAFIENEPRFDGLPVCLFGHSLGAYASLAVLQYNHPVHAVVAASSFNTPYEQMDYSIKKYTGPIGYMVKPHLWLYMNARFGKNAYLSAIDGINSSNIPILIYQGKNDSYYGDISTILAHREEIKNENCILIETEGHYDYFFSDEAMQYRIAVNAKYGKGSEEYYLQIDKMQMNKLNPELMDNISSFFMNQLIHE